MENKICFIGDQHGNLENLLELLRYTEEKYNPMLYIQVGDLGLMGKNFEKFLFKLNKQLEKYKKQLYFIDGNHENHKWLSNYQKFPVTNITNKISYINRGTILTIGKYNFLFVGGAFSVDRSLRELNVDYWTTETITEVQYEQIIQTLEERDITIDYLVSHDHPTPFNDLFNKKYGQFNFHSQSDYYEDSIHKNRLTDIWELAKFPTVISGHYHIKDILNYCGIENIILSRDTDKFEKQIYILET